VRILLAHTHSSTDENRSLTGRAVGGMVGGATTGFCVDRGCRHRRCLSRWRRRSLVCLAAPSLMRRMVSMKLKRADSSTARWPWSRKRLSAARRSMGRKSTSRRLGSSTAKRLAESQSLDALMARRQAEAGVEPMPRWIVSWYTPTIAVASHCSSSSKVRAAVASGSRSPRSRIFENVVQGANGPSP
jgi:hypothetical protein